MEQLSHSKQHLEAIFDAIPDPICTINKDYRITRLNKAYEILLDCDFKEILDQPCYTQLYRRSGICPGCPLSRLLKEGGQEVLQIQGAGQSCFRATCFPLMNKEGQLEDLVEISREITEELKIKKELTLLQEQILEKSLILAEQNNELEKAYLKIQRELELAQRVQQGIIPQELPRREELEVGIHYMPMEEVGGDLYDFISISPDLLGVLMLDVSGHGIPAAFIAAMAKMSFYLHALNNRSTARVLSLVNRDMCNNLHTDEFFFTTSYCLIDLITNTVKYSNAGHPPLLVLRKGQLEEVKDNSIIMGLSTDIKYSEAEISLQKGDRLIFFTDGIFETISPDKKFGFQRFCDILLASADLDVTRQVDRVKRELAHFSGEPKDDITLVIMELTLEDKYTCFRLVDQLGPRENVSIQAVRHPLDFDGVISEVLYKMDSCFFHDLTIRSTKYAIYEALSVYFRSRGENQGPVYFAFTCNKEKCTMVIVDSRFLEEENLAPYWEQEEHRGAVELIRRNVDSLQFVDGGRKIVITRHNE